MASSYGRRIPDRSSQLPRPASARARRRRRPTTPTVWSLAQEAVHTAEEHDAATRQAALEALCEVCPPPPPRCETCACAWVSRTFNDVLALQPNTTQNVARRTMPLTNTEVAILRMFKEIAGAVHGNGGGASFRGGADAMVDAALDSRFVRGVNLEDEAGLLDMLAFLVVWEESGGGDGGNLVATSGWTPKRSEAARKDVLRRAQQRGLVGETMADWVGVWRARDLERQRGGGGSAVANGVDGVDAAILRPRPESEVRSERRRRDH